MQGQTSKVLNIHATEPNEAQLCAAATEYPLPEAVPTFKKSPTQSYATGHEIRTTRLHARRKSA